MSDDGGVPTADQRRKQFLFGSGRSYSAPPRKKWYRRNPLNPLNIRRMGGQHSFLHDRVVSRRLVGAIAAWHDLHRRLLHLSSEKVIEDSNDHNSEVSEYESEPEKYYSSEEDSDADQEWKDGACSEGDGSDSESDDTLDETVQIDRTKRIHGKFSLSNPELTSVQLKQMFPELSEHWRLVLVSLVFSTCSQIVKLPVIVHNIIVVFTNLIHLQRIDFRIIIDASMIIILDFIHTLLFEQMLLDIHRFLMVYFP